MASDSPFNEPAELKKIDNILSARNDSSSTISSLSKEFASLQGKPVLSLLFDMEERMEQPLNGSFPDIWKEVLGGFKLGQTGDNGDVQPVLQVLSDLSKASTDDQKTVLDSMAER